MRELGEEWPLEWVASGSSRALFASKLGDSSNIWRAELTQKAHSLRTRAASPEGRDASRIPRGRRPPISTGWRFPIKCVNYDVWNLPANAERPKQPGDQPGGMTRLTNSISTEWAPSISADGQRLLYITTGSGDWNLVLKELDSGHTRTLVSSPAVIRSASISGDGQQVAYTDSRFDLMTTPGAGGPLNKVCDYCGTITGVSRDGNLVLYEPVKDEDLTAFDVRASIPSSWRCALHPT